MRCGQCGKLIKFAEELSGKSANCTACNALIQVPTETDPLYETRLDNPVLSREVARAELIKFFCHFCGQRLGVSRSLAGEQFACPDCQAVNNVPSDSDETGEEHVTLQEARAELSWLFPVVMVVLILLAGVVVYRTSGAFRESTELAERHAVGAKLALSRRESLELRIDTPAGAAQRWISGTSLDGELEVQAVDSLGVPTGYRLRIERYARGSYRGAAPPKQVLQPDAALSGKQLVVKPDGTLLLDGREAAASAGRLTRWLFAELSLLATIGGRTDSYTLPEEQARRAPASALFDGIEQPRVSWKLTKHDAGRWTLAIALEGTGLLGQMKVKLSGKGTAVYLPAQKLLSELFFEATVSASDFEAPGQRLEGKWTVELSKRRRN